MDRRSFLKMAAIGALACAVPCAGPVGALARVPEVRRGFPVADSHFHFVDFLQQTEGMKALFSAMDHAGVEHVMFSGMPLTKKWDAAEPVAPTYYLDDNGRTYWYSGTDYFIARRYEEAPQELRRRLHPFICGVNPTDKYAVLHVERMISEFPGLWRGIGELFCHRDDLTNLTYGETARANHPALDPVYELAGSRGLPVCIHNNATSRRKLERPIYVHEVRDALARHPRTTIIWAHAGLSRYLDLDQAEYTDLLRGMLARHPNLHVDLSWIIFENYVLEPRSGTVRPEWLSLVQGFPDRFMIGSDNVGHFETYGRNIVKYDVLLDALNPEDARLVALDNFLRLVRAGSGAARDAA